MYICNIYFNVYNRKCSKKRKSNHRNFHNKDPSLAHTGVSVSLSVCHSMCGPHPTVFIRRRNTLQKKFVRAEGTRKKSV